MDSSVQTSDRELVITRVVNAPRELVWQAWNDPAHVSNWWGPDGFSTTTYSKDVRVGGEWRFTMHGPDGTDYENRIVYTDVTEPARLGYDHFGGGDDETPHFVARTEFAEVEGGTEITLRMTFPTAEMRNAVAGYAIPGGQQTLARFAKHLGGLKSNSISMTRELAAPPQLVWQCFTEPQHYREWFGPDAYAMDVCTIDLRVGGRTFTAMRGVSGDAVGNTVYCGLKFTAIEPGRRLVTEGYFADKDGNEVPASHYGATVWPDPLVFVAELEPSEAGTQLTVTETVLPLPNQEQNWREMLDSLEKYLQKMQ